MAISRGELKGKILRLFHKTAKNPGPYTDDKLNDAIEEALDFVAVEMFINDEGWQTKVQHFDTSPGQLRVDLPPHIAMVKAVRYLDGDIYVDLAYDAGNDENVPTMSSSIRQWAQKYQMLDNAIVFRPAMQDGGANYLEVEYMAYPRVMMDDAEFIEPHFDKCMLHFIRYKAGSIMCGSTDKASRAWAQEEAQWYQKLLDIVTKRNAQSTPIREFNG